MKLMLNGACTLGTYDGANIEIFEQAGIENNYVFGATVEELNAIKADYDPNAIYAADEHLKRVIDALGDGTFEPADAPMNEGELVELKKALLEGASWHKPDHYFLLKDYASYIEAKLNAIRDTRDEIAYAKKCLHNIAGAGKFSSDRTIQEYWNELWA
jgi:starch phosphorylase